METQGMIEEIWRYPVSSLGGERMMSADLEQGGIVGDRIWCVVDAETGQPATPEKEERWRPALFLHSRLNGDVPEVGFPDGTWLSVLGNSIGEKLSEHFGFETLVRPYLEEGVSHSPDGRVATNRYTPSPLHLLTTNSLEHLSSLVGTESVQSRRFRPNVVLRMPGPAEFLEKSWLDQTISLGHALLKVDEETKRCGLTLIAQPDIDENPDILRTILRQNRRNFGVYASIVERGTIHMGETASVAVA